MFIRGFIGFYIFNKIFHLKNDKFSIFLYYSYAEYDKYVFVYFSICIYFRCKSSFKIPRIQSPHKEITIYLSLPWRECIIVDISRTRTYSTGLFSRYNSKEAFKRGDL